MKITAVTPWIITGPGENAGAYVPPGRSSERQYVFVQVETDEGVTGWGEITTYPGPVANRGIAAMLREVGPFLVGEDPAHIEAIWNKLFRVFTYMGSRGATTAMVSGVDIALWDIRGKVKGQPIYMLLGGPVRDAIALYTHYGYTPDVAAFVETALTEVRAGIRAIKTDPFFEARAGIAFTDGQISAAAEQRGIDLIAATRAAVGPEIELLIDCHGHYDVPTGIRLAQRLAPYDIGWFEEPVPRRATRRSSRCAIRSQRASVSASACTRATSSCRSSRTAWLIT